MSAPTPAIHGLPEVEKAPVVRPSPDGKFGVVSALCRVIAALPNIGKDDRSPEGYQYRGIEAITRHVQALFAENELLPIPAAEVLSTVPSPAMKEGWQDVIMRVEWTIAHSDGSSITAVTNGIGRDRSDKGANKAQTQSFKYLLLPLLLIADGKDDADGQTYEAGHRPEQTIPAAPKEKVDQIVATVNEIDAVDVETGDKFRGWVAAKNLPEHPKQLTEPQADQVLSKLEEFKAQIADSADKAART